MSQPSPRRRMIESAAVLMRERGVEGMSFTDVLAHSGAPRGSIYHHFPDGKAELVVEATRYAGDFIAAGMVATSGMDPVEALQRSLGRWRRILRESRFGAGCPVVAATLEGERLPAARDAAADAFGTWQAIYAERLCHAGVPAERAESLAATVIAAMEGAIILARAQRSEAPLEKVAAELGSLLRAAIQEAAAG